MDVLAAGLMLAGLTAINFGVLRSALYPPVIFSAVWALLLTALFFRQEEFYPISSETILLYVGGAVAFSLGGGVILLARKGRGLDFTLLPPPNPVGRVLVQRNILRGILLLLLVAFPLYLRNQQQLSEAVGVDFWVGLRMASSGMVEVEPAPRSQWFSYLSAFSGFAILLAGQTLGGKRADRITLIGLGLLALAYQFLSSSKTGIGLLLCAFATGQSLRMRRLALKPILGGVLGFVLLFAVSGLLLRKGGDREASLEENVASISETFETYALAAVVAFDQVVEQPDSVDAAGGTFRFFKKLGKALGWETDVPDSPVLAYTFTPRLTNVYTTYFPYFADFGPVGCLVIPFVIGMLLTRMFLLAWSGSPFWMFLYSWCSAPLAIVGFTETFVSSISLWIQASIVGFCFFRVVHDGGSRNRGALPLAGGAQLRMSAGFPGGLR